MATHHDRMIFNYTLPTDFYQPSQHRFNPHWTSSPVNYSSIPRTIPAGGFIDPRELQRSYSSSSKETDYPHSIRAATTNSSRHPVYPVVVHQSHGHQPSYTPSGHSAAGGGRRGTTNKHHSSRGQTSLPSPPLSPHPRSTSMNAMFPTMTTTTVTSSSRHFCEHPSCLDPETNRSTRSFSRHADLIRHQKSVHATVDEDGRVIPKYDCPRSRCNRKGTNGFTRLDHLTEHRRGYHGEDIPRRRTSATGEKYAKGQGI